MDAKSAEFFEVMQSRLDSASRVNQDGFSGKEIMCMCMAVWKHASVCIYVYTVLYTFIYVHVYTCIVYVHVRS